MMKEQEFLTRLMEEVANLQSQLIEAGPAMSGDIKIQLDQKIKLLTYYQQLFSRSRTAKRPGEIKIHFYVFVGTKGRVKSIIDHETFCKFENDRYHADERSRWKPFRSHPDIEDLTGIVFEKYGATPIYIDEEPENKVWSKLDTEIENSVVVMDLFSIGTENMLVAHKFDTKKAGVIMPLCRTLSSDLVEIASKNRERFKSLHSSEDDIPCECYVFDIASADSFKKHLVEIFRRKFALRNQAIIETPLLDFEISLQ